MNSLRNPHYSYQFSADAVDNFIESTYRASQVIAKSLGLSLKEFRKSLIKCFAHNQPRWRCLKKTIKMVNDQEIISNLRGYDMQTSKFYLTAVRSMADDWYLDALESGEST